jgi:hypothetical protein
MFLRCWLIAGDDAAATGTLLKPLDATPLDFSARDWSRLLLMTDSSMSGICSTTAFLHDHYLYINKVV